MSRRAPPDPADFAEHVTRPPRWTTPPGVTLRPLAVGETNTAPVLVCVRCNHPQPHDNLGTRLARCRVCAEERRW